MVVLAAGMGTRLRGVHQDKPKGFVNIGGRPIIARSVETLRAAGLREMVFVVGWEEGVYRKWLAREYPEAVSVTNAAYATTGSLASLVLGCAAVPGRDVLVVESDLLYEPRGVEALLASPHPDVLLVSGETGSGDEVWTYADDSAWLAQLSKTPWGSRAPAGELVGISRFSAGLVAALTDAARGLPDSAHYEDGLNAVCAEHPVSLLRIEDLAWCEIDDSSHLARARGVVWPRIAAG